MVVGSQATDKQYETAHNYQLVSYQHRSCLTSAFALKFATLKSRFCMGDCSPERIAFEDAHSLKIVVWRCSVIDAIERSRGVRNPFIWHDGNYLHSG